jgi:hypothetical protein
MLIQTTNTSPLPRDAGGSENSASNGPQVQNSTPSASALVGASGTSSLQVPPPHDKVKADEHLYESPEWWIAVLTAALVLVTWRLVGYTKKLWASTADLVKDAGDKSERELRAYISAVLYELPRFMADQSAQVKFLLTNHGKTPAHDFRISCKIAVWPFPLPQAWDFGGGYTAVSGAPIVFPDAQRSVTFTSDDVLSRQTIREILEDGTRRLYIAGVVQYKDAFDADQKTTFCASVEPNLALRYVSEGQEVKAGIVFQDSDQHNDAT